MKDSSLNALRVNIKPSTLAYLDAVINEQDATITALANDISAIKSQIVGLETRINRAVQQVNDMSSDLGELNDVMANNLDYSLTRAKLARLLKTLEID